MQDLNEPTHTRFRADSGSTQRVDAHLEDRGVPVWPPHLLHTLFTVQDLGLIQASRLIQGSGLIESLRLQGLRSSSIPVLRTAGCPAGAPNGRGARFLRLYLSIPIFWVGGTRPKTNRGGGWWRVGGPWKRREGDLH